MTPSRRETPTPDELLQMAFDRPRYAFRLAEEILESRPTLIDASGAHQTIGLVHREFGDITLALRHLRTAVRCARSARSDAREADALATLGHTLIHAGKPAAGMAALDEALARSSGLAKARIRYRRGASLEILGRHDDALADLRVAIPALRRAGDDVWTGRALTFRGLVGLACGDIVRADRDFRAAEEIHKGTGQRHEYAVARWNRGLVAFRSGDLPAALELLDDAARRCRELDSVLPDLIADRCAVLLAAGLAREALEVADAAATELQHKRGMITRRAELLLVAASAAYADGDYAGAERRASATVQAFGRQGRAWWREHAVLLRLQARFHVDRPSARLLSAAAAVAARLHALASPDAIQADLLTGRIAIALGRPGAARAPLDRAARFRRSGSVATRVSGWLARALLASAEGRDAAMTAACRQGLNLLDEYQLTLGATELRARVTSQGGELAELLQRSALRSGRPRQLLLGSERWRATACAIPPVRPPDDSAALVDLVALRDVTTRLDKARRDNEPLGVLHRERSRLERQVRDRALRTSGTSSGPRIAPVDVGELLDRIGDARLLELVEIDGDLHVLVCGSGRVRRVSAGRAAVAADAVDQAGWLLRSIAHSGPSRSTDVVSPPVGRGPGLDGPRRTAAVRGRLNRVGAVLEAELLGAAVDDLGDGAVVVVPPGRLQGTPWALLPSLAGRAHSVAPSARAWLTALATPRPEHRTVLVRGPGLSTGGAEIDVIAPHHPGALILGGADATTAAVIEALESSSLAHVAAHGTFRADSPSFSSLRMHDGPLTVYDLERLRRGPHRLVLPSCDSARLQPVGADEMLGLATALLPLGTAALVAGVVPVHDAATVPIMAALHEALARGATMAEALLHARLTAPDDQLHWATARSFVAFGAA